MKVKIDHINMTVRDLKASMDWYKKVFDFEFLEGDLDHATEPWAIVGKDDTMMCLYEDTGLKSAKDTEGAYHRVYHFGLRVSDDVEWERKVRELGLKIRYGGAYKYPHSVSWYLLDPSGHEIEVSYAEGGGELKFG